MYLNVLFLLLIFIKAQALEYLRPAPFLKVEIQPSKAVDNVSFSLLTYLHKQLFSLNDENIPMPVLVNDFNVSNDHKIFEIYLGNFKFRSGKKLQASDVKYTIENFIENKVVNWEKMLNIDEINVDDINNIVIFKLKQSDTNFLYKLTDQRLSIIFEGMTKKDGLGDYKIVKLDENEVILETTNQLNKFDKIIYRKYSKKKAIELFKSEVLSDLVLYPLEESEIQNIKNYASLSRYHNPRTYAIFMNSRILDIKQRKKISEFFDSRHIVESCLPQQKKAKFLIPPGFKGHMEGDINPISQKRTCPKIKDIDIYIPKTIQGEKCLVEYFANLSKKCPNLKSKLVDFTEIINPWIKNKLAVYLGYIEGEQAEDIFSHFLNNSSFLLGIENDYIMNNMIDRFHSEMSGIKKDLIAQDINKHIDELKTVIPLFYETMFYVLSKKYFPIDVGIRASTMVNVNELKLVKKI
ncbi:MAG: hypothetical protein H6622_18000 [Halobacteriovoraceae bacterium]|nr:hypothetical protein [Halobacteriovoraceae bacterium]